MFLVAVKSCVWKFLHNYKFQNLNANLFYYLDLSHERFFCIGNIFLMSYIFFYNILTGLDHKKRDVGCVILSEYAVLKINSAGNILVSLGNPNSSSAMGAALTLRISFTGRECKIVLVACLWMALTSGTLPCPNFGLLSFRYHRCVPAKYF